MSISTGSIAKLVSSESLTGDLIPTADTLFGTIWINPERMSGAPCFHGTRVPIQNLFDYLEGGETLTEFLEGFPGVTHDQTIAVLELARKGLLANLPKP